MVICWSHTSLMSKHVLFSSIYPYIKEGDCSDAWKCVARHFKNGDFRSKALTLISTTVLWYMMTPSESTLLYRLSLESLQGYCMVVNISIKKTFMKEYFSVHHLIIWTVLKSLISMLLSIYMVVNFVFNARMKLREKNQQDANRIVSLMQWLKLLNIR